MRDIKIVNQDNETRSLDYYKGTNLVLFFYPKDNTPGWTSEAKEFSELIEDFKKLETNVVGISKDTVKSHVNFINKHDLKIELLSDPERLLHSELKVIKEKSIFGKTALGTERSTFVFDKDGKLIKEFRKVKAKGHAKEVLDFMKENES